MNRFIEFVLTALTKELGAFLMGLCQKLKDNKDVSQGEAQQQIDNLLVGAKQLLDDIPTCEGLGVSALERDTTQFAAVLSSILSFLTDGVVGAVPFLLDPQELTESVLVQFGHTCPALVSANAGGSRYIRYGRLKFRKLASDQLEKEFTGWHMKETFLDLFEKSLEDATSSGDGSFHPSTWFASGADPATLSCDSLVIACENFLKCSVHLWEDLEHSGQLAADVKRTSPMLSVGDSKDVDAFTASQFALVYPQVLSIRHYDDTHTSAEWQNDWERLRETSGTLQQLKVTVAAWKFLGVVPACQTLIYLCQARWTASPL